MNQLIRNNGFRALINEVKLLVKKARHNAAYAVNAEMLKADYEIGKRIVEEEQKGSKRAEYRERLIERVSSELIKEFGRRFSTTALKNMRIFYLIYKQRIGQSLTDEFHHQNVYILFKNNNYYLSPQYDFFGRNAGHPFLFLGGIQNG